MRMLHGVASMGIAVCDTWAIPVLLIPNKPAARLSRTSQRRVTDESNVCVHNGTSMVGKDPGERFVKPHIPVSYRVMQYSEFVEDGNSRIFSTTFGLP